MIKYLVRNVSNLVPEEDGVIVQLPGGKALTPGKASIIFSIPEGLQRLARKTIADQKTGIQYPIIKIQEISYTIGTAEDVIKIEKLAESELSTQKKLIQDEYKKKVASKSEYEVQRTMRAVEDYNKQKNKDEIAKLEKEADTQQAQEKKPETTIISKPAGKKKKKVT